MIQIFLLDSFGNVCNYRYLRPSILAFQVAPDQPKMVYQGYFAIRFKVMGYRYPISYEGSYILLDKTPIYQQTVLYLNFRQPWSSNVNNLGFNGSVQVPGSCLYNPIPKTNHFGIFGISRQSEMVSSGYYVIRAKVLGSRGPYPIEKG